MVWWSCYGTVISSIGDGDMQLWHCADMDYKTMASACREIVCSDIGVSDGRHFLDEVVAHDVASFWDVVGRLRTDWVWGAIFLY